jgi:hypothetical protein
VSGVQGSHGHHDGRVLTRAVSKRIGKLVPGSRQHRFVVLWHSEHDMTTAVRLANGYGDDAR